MNFQSSNIEAVIFDLGGVLLNIDYTKTIVAFRELGLGNVDEVFSQHQQDSFFDQFETGEITPDEFRNAVRKFLPKNISDDQIDAAWNEMLLDFPAERYAFLKQIAKNKRIFLLSNTNAIHMEWFIPKMKTWFGENFFDLFEEAHLSHEVGLRKPHVEIFEWVLKENGLTAANTFFVDDSKQHIEGANKAGIQTLWLEPGMNVVTELAAFLT